MKKPNLILIHSFPTNSIILKGLIAFLEDFFIIHFIDLPGFHPKIKRLNNISIENYVIYVKKYIKKLNLEEYYLGGISFGFLIANKCSLEINCKGIFAIEPCIGFDYLKNAKVLKIIFKPFLSFINKFNLHYKIYSSNIFKKILLLKHNRDIVELTLKTVDGKTFFKTADIIINYPKITLSTNKPCVLIINKKDEVINSKKTIEAFNSYKKLLIIYTNSKHYPNNPNKAYFLKNININDIYKAITFLKKQK